MSEIDYAAEWESLRETYIWMANTFPAHAKELELKAANALVKSLLVNL